MRENRRARIVSDARDRGGEAQPFGIGGVGIGEVIEVDTEPAPADERRGDGERSGELCVVTRLRPDLVISRLGDRAKDGCRQAKLDRLDVARVEPVLVSHRECGVDAGVGEVVRRIGLVERSEQFPPLAESTDDGVGIVPRT